MAIKSTPSGHAARGREQTSTATGQQQGAVLSGVAGRLLAALRIVMGFVFLWAFADKAFGFGYNTAGENAWINGGSPTTGYLSGADTGPFAGAFNAMAGAAWADWLFMIGLAGIGVALLLGVGMRLAAGAGAVMMLLMWAADWPLARFTEAGDPTMSTNPLIQSNLVYALVIIVLAVVYAGHTWGLGRWWSATTLVRRWRWLV
ncbi:DoxX family membrane protein [Haloechinothrix sp. LS1_15]|uniref:DoxX family membrane protein n=1 Tax=Haloechinothrix sp. LS1_15 TaxID=2652248 RepID=UPI002944E67B|nr:DoxX family membrane protein [Haloechinothrix sp. LS1_15]MDV6014238.1 DoxX family membrane protein [Haloechinothrix sp. LS1_15]